MLLITLARFPKDLVKKRDLWKIWWWPKKLFLWNSTLEDSPPPQNHLENYPRSIAPEILPPRKLPQKYYPKQICSGKIPTWKIFPREITALKNLYLEDYHRKIVSEMIASRLIPLRCLLLNILHWKRFLWNLSLSKTISFSLEVVSNHHVKKQFSLLFKFL